MPEILLSRSPKISLVSGLVTPADADHLIAIARHRVTRAPVYVKGDEREPKLEIQDSRTAHCCEMKKGHDEVARRLEERAAEVCGVPSSRLEPMQIIRYRPGEKFDPHFDWFDDRFPSYQARLDIAGQRLATLIVYLTDVEEGGETSFPRLDIKIRPRRGWAAYWENCPPGTTTGDRRTLHGGDPVIKGEKWVASIWILERPHPSSLAAAPASS